MKFLIRHARDQTGDGYIDIAIVVLIVFLLIAADEDISGAIWGAMGYTVLLCFTLFKTGSLAKSIINAH